MKKERRLRDREPSAASLREIPEVEFSKVSVRRNPYAARIAREGITVQVGRGRPRKLLEVGGTRPRSVRFPEAVWRQIEARAKARGLTVHAALREAILAWLRRAETTLWWRTWFAPSLAQQGSRALATLPPRHAPACTG
jgi:hypothetical protein